MAPTPSRSLVLLLSSLALGLGLGCGSDSTAPNGDGGGGDDGRPRIERLDPSEGGIGSSVVIHGANFAKGLSNNRVQFNRTDSTILEIDPDLKWVRTRVPSGATTGKVTMQVNHGQGFVSIEGPVFTVNDDRPTPSLSSVSPKVVTEGFEPTRLTLSGGGFVEGSRVLFDGTEVEASRNGSTAMSFTLTPEMVQGVGSYEIQVINDPPGGGSSGTLRFDVVGGVRLLDAGAVGDGVVLMIFDRAVARPSMGSQRNPTFQITPRLQVADVAGVEGHPNVWALQTGSQGVGVDYELEILRPENIRTSDGGTLIGESKRSFRSFRYPPVEEFDFGATGCDATSFNEPVSISFVDETAYVVEASGNQIQLLDVTEEGLAYNGFLGSDGSGSGRFEGSVTADGCPGSTPTDPEGLDAPAGSVGIGPNQEVYVSSTGSGEIVRLSSSGERALFLEGEESAWSTSTVLGIWNGELYFAGDDDVLRIVSTSTMEERVYGRSGGLFNEFRFGISDGRIPQIAINVDDDIAYVVEPGNHRVHQINGLLEGGATSRGVIGKDSGFFKWDLEPFPTPGPGTAPGEFTNPTGIAIHPNGTLMVADEAGGGRLQRFQATGEFIESIPLGFLPGGMAVDPFGYLWITAPEEDRLYRFRL